MHVGLPAYPFSRQAINEINLFFISLYVFDLGVCERMLSFERPWHEYSGVAWDPDELEGGAPFIALARILQDRLDKKEGMAHARVTQIINTLKIDEGLAERILRGEFGYVPERLLRTCVRYGTEAEQRRLLEENAKTVRPTHSFELKRPPRRVGRQNKLRAEPPAYVTTEPTQEQMAILRGLRMKALIDPEEIAESIKPRWIR